jgi:hypothetical protein
MITTAAALLTVAVVAVLTFVAPGAGTAGPHKFAFTVVAQEAGTTVTPADFFTAPPAQNAQGSLSAPVTWDGAEVGTAETILTFTRAGDDPVAIIECSVELPDGNVLFNGSVHLAALGTGADVPVVGGTGKYAGARGTVTMVAVTGGTDLRFHFRTN